MTIQEARGKLKKGMKVKVQDGDNWEGEVLCVGHNEGFYISRGERNGGACFTCNRNGLNSWYIDWRNTKAIIEILDECKDLIIHCPTKELFERVQRKEFERGNCWSSGKKELHDTWDRHKKETCISLLKEDKGKMLQDPKTFWKENFSNIPIISAEEYLREYEALVTQQFYPPFTFIDYGFSTTSPKVAEEKPLTKKTFMSVIKNAFKSKEQKALDYFSITNGDGGLTEQGREELLDYLWETDKEMKDAFVKKVVEEYEEQKKK